MTKQLKVGLFALIIIAIAIGIYFINASNQSNSAQAGYDLYQQGDANAAVEQFKKNADQDSQSAYALAMMYKDGIGVEPDDEVAQRYLVKAAEANNKNALYNLGYYRYNREMDDTEEDRNGLTSLIKAADLGVKEAQELVGSVYIKDRYDEIPQDIKLARQYFTLAADQGSHFAKFALGYIAHQFDKDNKKAVEILTPLVSNDFPLPAMLLATIYEEGGNGITANPTLAKKYERMSYSSTLGFLSESDDMEPAPLSLYGSLTAEEKQQIIANLEERASKGEEHAIYTLYHKYTVGEDVKRSQFRAMAYLRPLIEQKKPKALYLSYLADESKIQALTEAANQQYPDAMYAAYRVYSGTTFHNVERNNVLANKYLTSAADLGHQEALITITQLAISDYDFPTKKLNATVEKYLPELMRKYPNSAKAQRLASQVYGTKGSAYYSPEKSFEAIEKANRIQPTYDTQMQLARDYINGFGTEKNLEKATQLLKANLDTRGYPSTADRMLVQLYYRYDIKEFVDEKTVVDILKKDVVERNNDALAHFYADYLLRQDAEKNKKFAFELYEKSSEYDYNGRVYYAAALLKYQPTEINTIANILVDLLRSSQAKSSLTDEELNTAYDILFRVGLKHEDTKILLVDLAVTEKNAEAQKLIEPLIGTDADITYQYGIKQLTNLKNVSALSNDELKPYYDNILKAADLGSTAAILYIAQNLDRVNYLTDKAYYKDRFQAITGLTPDDLIPQYKRCAALGNNRCLYELGEIYQKGDYGEDANYDLAMEYYNKISDPDFSFLKSRKSEIEKARAAFITLQANAKNNDPDALRSLANAYKFGNYGQKVDKQKWLDYLEKSAKLNNETALEELIDYYNENAELQSANKNKIIGYYDQLAALGNKSYTRELAHQYLSGSQLVDVNRQKAREYYLKSGSWGDQYIKYMDDFDIGMKTLNASTSAKYNVGSAYLYGNGVKEDRQEAMKYLKMASDEGNDNAIILYSKMLYMGELSADKKTLVVEPNWDEAIVYLRKHSNPKRVEEYTKLYDTTVIAAQNGDAAAAEKLGDWYKSQGHASAAQLWYKKAIAGGNLAVYPSLNSVTEDKQDKRQNYLDGVAKNDLFSKVQLADAYLYDSGVTFESAEYNAAIQYLQEGMKSTDSELSKHAFNSLANLYQKGIRSENNDLNRSKDDKKYFALLESEAPSRPDALKRLYRYYASSDPQKALGYLEQAHKQGDMEAIKMLYEINSPGRYCANSRNTDMDKAGSYLKEWLEKGKFGKNTDRTFIQEPEDLTRTMGDLYLKEECGVEQDLDKAIEWFEISLKYNDNYALNSLYDAYVLKGDAKQAYYIALRLEKDTDNIALINKLSAEDKHAVEQRFKEEQDFQKYGRFAAEIEAKRVKAEAGDKMAAFSLGINYARGEMVPEDTQKMIYYYELAGKNGYSRAYNILGNLYRKDNERGIEKDFAKALYYFDLGAQQNDSNTAHLAGDMLYFGQGMPKDYVRAAKYYDMTDLEQGSHHAMAKYKLAYMYYHGWIGTKSKEDLQKAYDYLQLGAKYQDKDAINALKKWDFSSLQK
ncbi:sel1 repeat family protein [Providencia rettgeri]|uniref:tetratricopeptide repeat protein n=1 Tax=Providencia rettgeri TaxID=587 RepID=UPI0034E0B1F0